MIKHHLSKLRIPFLFYQFIALRYRLVPLRYPYLSVGYLKLPLKVIPVTSSVSGRKEIYFPILLLLETMLSVDQDTGGFENLRSPCIGAFLQTQWEQKMYIRSLWSSLPLLLLKKRNMVAIHGSTGAIASSVSYHLFRLVYFPDDVFHFPVVISKEYFRWTVSKSPTITSGIIPALWLLPARHLQRSLSHIYFSLKGIGESRESFPAG